MGQRCEVRRTAASTIQRFKLRERDDGYLNILLVHGVDRVELTLVFEAAHVVVPRALRAALVASLGDLGAEVGNAIVKESVLRQCDADRDAAFDTRIHEERVKTIGELAAMM